MRHTRRMSSGRGKTNEGIPIESEVYYPYSRSQIPSENCRENLAKCYTASLDLARKYDIHSIAFPSISTGKFSYPKKEASEIAVKSVHTWITENDDYDIKVVFSCVDPKLYELLYTRLCCL